MSNQKFLSFKTESAFYQAVTEYESSGWMLTYYHISPGEFTATFQKMD